MSETTKLTTFPVIEIFDSIQGEGTHMGRYVTFIRLSGCNLRCPWCDTKNSWDGPYTEMTVAEIIDKVPYPCNVVITGGEPTIHEHLHDLIDALQKCACYVMIETNGTNNVPVGLDWVTASPKPPDYFLDPQLIPWIDELKYVITDDFNEHRAIPEGIRNLFDKRIWLQPDGTNDQTMERAWQKCFEMVQEDHRLRVGVQLHKIMEVQ